MSRNDEEIRASSQIWESFDEEKSGSTFEKIHEGKENLSNDVIEEPRSPGKGQFPVIEAGEYYLGPVVKKYVRNPITQCLVRRKGTDNYYLMKILVLRDGNVKDKRYLHHRALFHNEYSILSLLKGHPAVIEVHDFFKDSIPAGDPEEIEKGNAELTRICMVLECLIPHGYHNVEYTTLTEYLAEKRRLSELEALHIFSNIIQVVDDLHKRNIVHRDLKLSNVIVNRRTLKIKLSNLCYAKLLLSDHELPSKLGMNSSYTSPDVVTVLPVAQKPCDMWSTGVILYTMLHGYLPFVKNANLRSAIANTRAIYAGDYVISNDINLSDGTKRLLRSLLSKDPILRFTSCEVLNMVSTIMAPQLSSQFPCSHHSDQIVPECPSFEENRESSPCSECWLIVNANEPSVASKTYKIAISEVDGKRWKEIKAKAKEQEVEEMEEPRLKSEKEVFSRSAQGKIISRRNSMSRNSKIKFAMLRLGATSVNNINALSFNYSDRNTSRSQL